MVSEPLLEPPSSWRAAVLRKAGDPLVLVDLVAPALAVGQVLVKLSFSGVCRSQVMEVRGLRGADPWLPHLLGHEGVGVVVAVGEAVTKVAPGDEVIVGWIAGEGMESEAPTFMTTDGERINAGRVTTFSEYTVVSENRVYFKPETLTVHSAALFGCALLTGAGMVLNEAQPEPGESVLINGLGAIGFSALIAAHSLGAVTVAVDPDQTKRDLAMELGAVAALHPKDLTTIEALTPLFPRGADVAIDASGSKAGIEAAFGCLRFGGGRLIFASHPPTGQRICLDPHDLIRGRTIQGSWGGGSNPDFDIPRLAEMLSSTGTDLGFMFPRIYELGEINEAVTDLERNLAMRPLVQLS